jgi:hypothetical protein
MAVITWSDVTAVIPEMSAVTTTLPQTLALAVANTRFAVAEWDGESSEILKLARILMAAHLALVSLPGTSGSTGPVVSESGGGLSVAYASLAAKSDGTYDSVYMQQINTLRKTRACRAWVVV